MWGGRIVAAQPKQGEIVHVEIIAKETEGVKKFFSSLFGWKFQDMPEMKYATWAAPGGPGGGLTMPTPEAPGTGQPLNYIYVESINKIAPRIERAGGKIVVPKTTIGGGFGSFAFFTYPEGMIWGLYESTPRPASPRKTSSGRAKAKKGRK
jgi:predicted enzyme related to lactoylglutathione lyase